MRILIRHTITVLIFVFVCKVAMQAQGYHSENGVPKSLLLSSLPPEQPIPSREIDATKIIAAIRNQ